MEKLLKYTHMGYKVSIERGAYCHVRIALSKNFTEHSQQVKDDHLTDEYLEEILQYLLNQFKK